MEQDFTTSKRKTKCTYEECDGDQGGGLVDDTMRTFHTGCISAVLSMYGRRPIWPLYAAAALGNVVGYLLGRLGPP